MAKPARSPVLGYNHNVRYHGRIYHVQTEDSGAAHTRVFTHLFYEGTIVASKRHDYDPATPEDEVRAFMQSLHKGILKELKRGIFDEKIIQHFTAVGEEPFLDQVSEQMPVEAAESLDAGPAPQAPMQAPDTIPSQAPPAEYSPTMQMPAAEMPFTEVPGAPAYVSGAEPIVALDLDALPPVVDDTPGPEPLGSPNTPPPVQRPYGAGVYIKRGGTTERPFERPRTNSPSPQRPSQSYPAIPRLPTQTPVTRPPVLVVRPPIRQAPVMRQVTKPPPGGVVVQRTVVVGVGGPGGAQMPRRPRPSVPYVVKEGSHPIQRNARAATVAPAIPQRVSSPIPAQAATISDKSLDEVILAYLSQDSDK